VRVLRSWDDAAVAVAPDGVAGIAPEGVRTTAAVEPEEGAAAIVPDAGAAATSTAAAERPESVSRFSRLRSARMSEAFW